MPNLLIIAKESKEIVGLSSELIRSGFECSIYSNGNVLIEQITAQSPDLILAETDGHLANSRIQELVQGIKQKRHMPVMALVREETLDSIDGYLNVDDFIISPYDDRELVLRIKRLIKINGTDDSELVEHNGLIIDLAKFEVSVDGKVVELTFKEYELLRFLVSNKGRVYTREALLNKVWGYDYYGGDRTVDVHIRRLRSKLEDTKHIFIETVRNIGYRFRDRE
ncbi:response regulator transcription factor [Chloroflexota bacterium]